MEQNHNEEGLKLKPAKVKPKLPGMYKVIILNDDFTPMEFVANIIQIVFNKTPDDATRVMLQIHTEGMGICGIYPFEIAETKMNQVLNFAKESQHPLQCIIEEI